jgi:hypothetical protein
LIIQLDYKGLNNLWYIFKVPIAVFSLSIPWVAIVASNHRSVQSKEQIKTSMQHNLMTVQPVISFSFDIIEDKLLLVFQNKGLGTAQIKSLKLSYEGSLSSTHDLEMKLLNDSKLIKVMEVLEFNPLDSGCYLAKDERFVFVKAHIKQSELTGELLAILKSSIGIEVEYSSLYSEDFSYKYEF